MRRIEYPRLPEGSASPAVRNAIRELVDQVNVVIAEMEKKLKEDTKHGGNG